jgi:hypothetical protein
MIPEGEPLSCRVRYNLLHGGNVPVSGIGARQRKVGLQRGGQAPRPHNLQQQKIVMSAPVEISVASRNRGNRNFLP